MRVYYRMSHRDEILKTVFNNHTITTKTQRTITYYYILDTIGKDCIEFHYYIDTDGKEGIFIDGLDRCSLNTGTELLNKIEEFAKKANIQRIQLFDASSIELCHGIRISLYYLNILCTGQSWYNKHGYKSEYHHDEIAHNREFINSPMIEYIKNDEDYLMLSNILNPDAEEPGVKGTIQEVFVQLKNYLINYGDNCSDPGVADNLEFIRDLIKAIGQRYIKYDGELLNKEITNNGGTKGTSFPSSDSTKGTSFPSSRTNGSSKRKRNKSKKSRRRKTASKRE